MLPTCSVAESVSRRCVSPRRRESGRGFYSPIDRRVEIGTRMLMYGFDAGFSHWDIPDGMVESLFGYGDNPFITVNARVGADHIKKTNAEVYTK